jgi:hypothetical protein
VLVLHWYQVSFNGKRTSLDLKHFAAVQFGCSSACAGSQRAMARTGILRKSTPCDMRPASISASESHGPFLSTLLRGMAVKRCRGPLLQNTSEEFFLRKAGNQRAGRSGKTDPAGNLINDRDRVLLESRKVKLPQKRNRWTQASYMGQFCRLTVAQTEQGTPNPIAFHAQPRWS